MKKIFEMILGYTLIIFSIMALFISFIPLLYLLVGGLSIPVIIISLSILYAKDRKNGVLNSEMKFKSFFLRVFDFRAITRHKWAEKKLNSRLRRACFISILSLLFNGFFYLLLTIHSWVFYVSSLDRELDPFRTIFLNSEKPLKPGKEE